MEFIGNECDLAVLRVAASSAVFFDGLVPLGFGELPELQDEVDVLGYPVGGESMSVTSGVVSRVEMQHYSQAGFNLLALQIDAAINPGNSGGPVVNMALECVGVAFQSLDGSDVENIGYVVPVTVVRHFLEDVQRNGRYTGWCSLGGVGFQLLENGNFRDFLGMSQGQTGVMITSGVAASPSLVPALPPPPPSSRGAASPASKEDELLLPLGLRGELTNEAAKSSLRAAERVARGGVIGDTNSGSAASSWPEDSLCLDDVLLSVDDIPVANDGTIPFRRGERVALGSYVSSRFPGDTLRARVWRRKRSEEKKASNEKVVEDEEEGDGGQWEEREVSLKLAVAKSVVPHHWDNQAPPYLVCGGLVFTCLSMPYLGAEGAFERYQTPELSYLAHLSSHSGFSPDSKPPSGGNSGVEGGKGVTNEVTSELGGDLTAEKKKKKKEEVRMDEVVILSLVLAHRVNLGYEHLENQHLVRFNDVPVTSLAHLSNMLDATMTAAAAADEASSTQRGSRRGDEEEGGDRPPSSPSGSFLRFEFAQGRVVVLECASAARATREICEANGVPAPSRLHPKCKTHSKTEEEGGSSREQ